MALRFRVTPTQTPADQVRSRCHLLLLRDGSTTVPYRYPCLRHYPTDAPLLLQLTPTHRYLILDRYCDRATPLSPLSLPPRTEMTHQPGRQFRGVETLVQATRTYGCSVPLAIAPPTDMLPRAWVPLGSVQAWSACLAFMNSLSMTAVVMQTPKQTHTLRAQSRLVCAPNFDKHRTLGLRPCSRQPLVTHEIVPRLDLPR